MPYEITNKLRQIQNLIIKGEGGKTDTLTLMPRGQDGFKKEIPDSAVTPDLEIKHVKGFIKLDKKS